MLILPNNILLLTKVILLCPCMRLKVHYQGRKLHMNEKNFLLRVSKESHDFVGGTPLLKSITMSNLVPIILVKVKIQRFLYVTWVLPCGYCRWWPLPINYHPVKSTIHRPCRSGNIVFLIFLTWLNVSTWSKEHVTSWLAASNQKLLFCQVWSPQASGKWRFYLPCDHMWPRD